MENSTAGPPNFTATSEALDVNREHEFPIWNLYSRFLSYPQAGHLYSPVSQESMGRAVSDAACPD
jgi:hypothetical protein